MVEIMVLAEVKAVVMEALVILVAVTIVSIKAKAVTAPLITGEATLAAGVESRTKVALEEETEEEEEEEECVT